MEFNTNILSIVLENGESLIEDDRMNEYNQKKYKRSWSDLGIVISSLYM